MNKFLQKEHSTPILAKYLFGRRTEQEACLYVVYIIFCNKLGILVFSLVSLIKQFQVRKMLKKKNSGNT